MTEHLQSLSITITQAAKQQIEEWLSTIAIPDPILTIAWVAEDTTEGENAGHWAFLISANNPRKRPATITRDGIEIYMPISAEEARQIQGKIIDSVNHQLTFVN
jgi:hypothetical protein